MTQKASPGNRSALPCNGAGATDNSSASTIMPLAQERLVPARNASTRTVATVRMRPHEREVPVTQSMQTGRVQIEGMAIDRTVSDAPQMRTEGAVTIIPIVEEVLVRQYHITEEIRITSFPETREHTETVTLRRQEATIEKPATTDITGQPGQPPYENHGQQKE